AGVFARDRQADGAGHGAAGVEGELHPVLAAAGREGDRGVDLVLGVADGSAVNGQDIALAGDAHLLAGAAQGVQHLGGDDRHVGLVQVDQLALRVVDLLDDGVAGSLGLAGCAAVFGRGAPAAGRAAAGAALVDDHRHHAGRVPVGNDDGGGAGAHGGDGAAAAHGGHAVVAGTEGQALRGAGRADAAADLGRLDGLEDKVVGIQVDAVGGDIHADADGAHDVPTGDGDGGGAFAHRRDPPEVVDGGDGLIGGGKGDGGGGGRRAGADRHRD